MPITDRLTTIASNDRLIVINTNHDVSDSGFIMNAVEHCLDDDIMSVFTQDKDISKEEAMVPIPDSVAFKAEIERAERKKPKLHPNEICTSYPFDVNDEHFVSQKPIQIHFDDELPIETLTCYDKKSKKPKQMNELIWTAITMNQNAMAKNIEGSYYKRQPLAIPTIVDTRRFADDQSKLNWRNTNCVTAVNLLADPTDDMKISDIFNLFRKDLNTHIKDDFFFWINNGSFPNQLGRAFGRNSGIGAVKIKRPVMDFFLQAVFDISDNMRFDHKSAVRLSLFSFTKFLPQKTVFCPTVYFQNSDSLLKETLVFKEAFRHFITEIHIDTNYKDALDELQSFQKNLLKNY